MLHFIEEQIKRSRNKKKWNRLTGRRGRDLAQRFNHKYTENLFLPIFYVVIFFSSKNALISWLRSKVTKNVQFNCTTMLHSGKLLLPPIRSWTVRSNWRLFVHPVRGTFSKYPHISLKRVSSNCHLYYWLHMWCLCLLNDILTAFRNPLEALFNSNSVRSITEKSNHSTKN